MLLLSVVPFLLLLDGTSEARSGAMMMLVVMKCLEIEVLDP